jgi:pimeloyl-ACP methyl ester carboxylesterase
MTPVYFLPGMMCDQQLWQQVWEYVPDNWACEYIAIDQCFDRKEMKQLIDKKLTRQKGHMVAFSMGGYLALEYALEHPQLFASLTMVGASAFGLPADERARRERHLPMLEQGSYKGISRHRVAQFVHPDKVDAPDVGGVVREMDARLGKETLIRQIRSVSLRESFVDDLPQLTVRTQLVGAMDDQVIRPDSLRLMESRIPDVQLHLLADTGHMIPLERPQELAQLLCDFIGATNG